MELLVAIDTRSSAPRLLEPGPTSAHLQRLFAAAQRAPDHGRLKPWRFILLENELRQKFAQAAAQARHLQVPTLSPEQLEGDRQKIIRSPCIVVIACTVRRDQVKVPEIEQVIAVGAAAQNFVLAAHDLGYGAMWKTGPAAYDAGVKACLDLDPQDHIIAIMHLGARAAKPL